MKAFKNITIRRLVIGLLPFYLFTFLPLHAQIGTWHNYLSYHDIQDIQAAGNDLFVQASNSLYQYNKKDQSIYTYDKTRGLSDTYITHIRWCQQARRLVVVYDDSNIDLVETNGNITNISDIYSKSITGGKNIYQIYCDGIYAYLGTDYGISKINVRNAEISESYMFNAAVNGIAIQDNKLYAKIDDTNNTVLVGDMSTNLIDPANWTKTSTYPPFDEDRTDYDANIDLVKTLNPGGPQYNEFYESKFVNGKLYTTGGAFLSGLIQLDNPGIVQVLDGTNWTIYPTNINETTGFNYKDNNCIDVDPTDNSHVVVAGRCGIYEFKNGILKTYHTKDNSPIRPISDTQGKSYLPDDYTIINGIKFDQNGDLWVLNSQTKDVNLLKLKKNGQWEQFYQSNLCADDGRGEYGMRCMMIDSRGLIWFINTHWIKPAIHCYNPSSNQLLNYTKFTNQDGTTYDKCYPYDIKEDHKGNIWIATNQGPFYIKNEEVGQSNVILYQEKVPRNDGTDLADYLLTGLDTRSVAVDGAGRKWFATLGNGVFLISEDNYQQIHHFTIDNSPLLSNIVNYISINPQSGEVFFLTENGLCSYVSDATEAATEMTKDNVWAYPNPVNPGYTGLITIVGLTRNADVKILAPNGALVYEGRSNGGSFTWNGCDHNGNPVASGVYMVATATNSGDKGTVCKIAIIR